MIDDIASTTMLDPILESGTAPSLALVSTAVLPSRPLTPHDIGFLVSLLAVSMATLMLGSRNERERDLPGKRGNQRHI